MFAVRCFQVLSLSAATARFVIIGDAAIQTAKTKRLIPWETAALSRSNRRQRFSNSSRAKCPTLDNHSRLSRVDSESRQLSKVGGDMYADHVEAIVRRTSSSMRLGPEINDAFAAELA
jgi:hypothetical protein